jgi:hypothetical protein
MEYISCPLKLRSFGSKFTGFEVGFKQVSKQLFSSLQKAFVQLQFDLYAPFPVY